MNNKELNEALSKFPEDAKIYRYCDHGQTPETGGDIMVGVFLGKEFPYMDFDEAITWLDPDDVAEDKLKLINCILIG